MIIRTTFLAAAALTFGSGAALAQKEPLKPAPVPGLSESRGAPADRAGRSNSSDNSSPFAGPPSDTVPGSGQATPQTLATPEKDAAPTPSLSR